METIEIPAGTIPSYTETMRAIRRSRSLRGRLGRALHPEAVTEAWYAADCPEPSSFAPRVSRRVWAQWRVACWLRGAR